MMNWRFVLTVMCLCVGAGSQQGLAEELSLTEVSNIKEASGEIGKYLGVLDTCESLMELSDPTLNVLRIKIDMKLLELDYLEETEDFAASDVKKAILHVMERSGEEIGYLSSVEDIIESNREEFREAALLQFFDNSRSTEAQLGDINEADQNLCVSAEISSLKFKDVADLPVKLSESLSILASYSNVK